MTNAELIAELRRRIKQTREQEQKTLVAWEGAIPGWATYFQGYRDAISEIIETIQDRDNAERSRE